MTNPAPADDITLPAHCEPGHPEPHTLMWTTLEAKAIQRHAEAYARAAVELDRASPSRAAVPDIDDAADILRNMIKGIEAHGMYSQESTLMSLQQAYFALRPANQAPSVPAAVDVGAAQAETAQAAPDTAPLPRKELEELDYWLGRCASKGHLDNCPDLIEPYEALCKAIAARATPGATHGN